MGNLDFEGMVILASQDTEKGAEIVAKAFYRILRKNSFSENQIISIASNIISYLTESLKGYEKKWKRHARKKM